MPLPHSSPPPLLLTSPCFRWKRGDHCGIREGTIAAVADTGLMIFSNWLTWAISIPLSGDRRMLGDINIMT